MLGVRLLGHLRRIFGSGLETSGDTLQSSCPLLRLNHHRAFTKIISPPLVTVLALWVCVALILVFAPGVIQAEAEERVVRVGLYQNKPKIFLDENNRPSGFFVEILSEIAQREAWTLIYVPCEWKACLRALKSGEIDLMPDVAYSSERDKEYDFHQTPVLVSWSRVYASPKAHIRQISDLDGKRIAVLQSSIQEKMFAQAMRNLGFEIDFVYAQSLEEAFSLVADGLADAAIANHFFGDYFSHQYHLVSTAIDFNRVELYFATAEGRNADLLAAIDRYLETWIKEPASPYFKALAHWADVPVIYRIPTAVGWAIGMMAGALIIAAGVVGVLGIRMRKNSQRLKQTKGALQESEVRFQALTEDLPALVCEFLPDGTLVYVNRAYCEYFGMSSQELIGEPYWSLIPEGEREYVQSNYLALTPQNPMTVYVHRLFQNGELRWQEWRNRAIFDEHGRVKKYRSIGFDITERKRIEERLAQERRQLLSIFDSMDEIIYVADPNTYEILYVNPSIQKAFGKSLIGGVCYKELQGLNAPCEFCTNDIILRQKPQPYRWEYHNPVLNRDFVLIDRMIEWPDGREVRFELAIDITERKQRQRQLEAIADVSAALRTVSSHADMMKVVLEQLIDVLGAEGACLGTLDLTSGEIEVALGRGQWTAMTGSRIPAESGLCGRVLATGEAYLSDEAYRDEALFPPNFVHPCPVIAGAPLIVEHKITGLLWVGSQRTLTSSDLQLLQSLANIAANALRRQSLYEQTVRQVEHLAALRSVDQAIAASLDLRVIFNVVLQHVITQLRADSAAILLLFPNTLVLQYAAGQGFRTDEIKRSRVRLGEDFTGRAALDRRVMGTPDLSTVEFSRAVLLSKEDFASYQVAPLIAKGELKGVLEVFYRSRVNFSPEWSEFLDMFAGQVAIAIDNMQLFENLQRANFDINFAYNSTLEAWSRAVEMRDETSEGHTRRVLDWTLRMAALMGVSEGELVNIRRGVWLHDVGEMGVPESILKKSGKLTDEEWELVRRHPQLAYELLSSVPYLRSALDIPYSHHERWDGSGYPRGLKGEEIPLAARLFAVADVYDALTSDRPYRQAWTKEKALEYIRSQAGSHFDPKAVEIFLQVLQEDAS